VLLRAYVEQFTDLDDVCLVIQTHLFRSNVPRKQQVRPVNIVGWSLASLTIN